MRTLTIPEFYDEFRLAVTGTTDHHFTGPLEAQTSFGAGGSLHHDEGGILRDFANYRGGPVLEIGADHGVSTRYIHHGLWLGCHVPEIHILAVDRDHKWNDDAEWPRRIRLSIDSRRLLPSTVLSTIGTPAWAFIDGDHSYEGALHDFLTASVCGARSFFFHDTAAHHLPYKCVNGDQSGSGVRQLLYDLDQDPDLDCYDIETKCGMGFVQLKVPEWKS